jgi:CubicO group peptidase (beta-lactamase class C family)
MKHTRKQRRGIPFAAFLLAALPGVPASAQDHAAEIDRLFAWTAPDKPGCTVAVSQHGKLVVSRAYGSADLERDVPITPETVFDAGSVTKQFVAAAVLLLVEDGRLSLSDDVRAHLPEMPDCGHRITLDHLLTHTSGIRDWTGLLRLARARRDALTLVLRQRSLNFPPGEEWSYSNSGYVLLKEIVARRSGEPFAEFTRKRLFEPLGMQATAYRFDVREVIKNRALAYEREGDGWRMAILLDDERGGQGGLFSTAADLVTWNDALSAARLGQFVTEKLHEPARLNSGRQVGYGRGLFLDSYRGARLVWHSGGAAGYKTWLGRFPDHALSIAIMCNSGEGTERTPLAHRIFELFAAADQLGAPEPAAPPIPDPASAPDLRGRAGVFVREGTGDLLRLAVDRGRLRVAGGPGMVPVGEDRFRRWGTSMQYLSGDAFELHFLSPDELDLKYSDGATVRYRRARPFAPSPPELTAFAGRYGSDEMDATFRVEPRGAGLDVRLEHVGEALDFQPIDRDTFQFANLTVRFERDEAGGVVAARYSNPVLRNVRFTRLNGGQ